MRVRTSRHAAILGGLLWLTAAAPAHALSNGLAQTPPMGWNPWYSFRCQVDERLVRETADAMVASGMRDAGYRYVNLDDCWMAPHRGPDGRLHADPVRFPSGLRALADYVHSRGLRFGIYQSPGHRTCAGYPGMGFRLRRDVHTFASWGVDYVKLDWCHAAAERHAPRVYAAMRIAIRRSGRPMVLSISNWGRRRPWLWGPTVGHLWRTNFDVGPRDPWTTLMRYVDRNERMAAFARPGAWNDPDILQVGHSNLSLTEQRAVFSLWSVMAAPLLAGNDLRTMSPETRALLTNRSVIAVDQDPAGVQGRRVHSRRGREVWVKPLANGDRAVVLFNRRPVRSLLWWDARWLWPRPARAYRVRSLWTGGRASTAGRIRVVVDGHGAAMLRVRRVG